MTYYPINEDAAKRAKDANSFFEYVPGSATHHYRAEVDRAANIAALQKTRVDPMYHGKIDDLLDKFAAELAEVINQRNAIDARVPSVMVAGGSNFPIAAKNKQNAARERNDARYNEVQDILRKIQSVGTGGIMSDDKNAIAKLTAKLEKLEKHQATMKAANAAIRMKDTNKGNAKLKEMGYTDEEIKQLRAPDFCGRIGYPDYEMKNNNANIRRIKARIAELEKEAQRAAENTGPVKGDGYELVEDAEIGRIQFIFDGKPDDSVRVLLKYHGFRWAPTQGAWQRMLNENGRRAAERVMRAINAQKEIL